MKLKHVAVLALPLLIAATIGVSGAFASTTLNVNNSPGCNDATGAPYYCTIGAAVAASSPGDTIMVAAGVGPYVESFGVNWALTLRGPNFGISPNGGSRVGEAVIDGGGSTAIRISTTDPVTIDGFTFSGGTGAFVDSYTTGNRPTIAQNIFTATGDGFFFANSDSVTFNDNYLHDISGCGACEGLFLAGNWNGSTGTVAAITSNVWSHLDSAGMNLSSVKGTLAGNHFSYVTYYGALLANDTNMDVTGNTFDHTVNPDTSVRTWGAGVRFYTPSSGFGARITGNTFSNNYVGIGVRMGAPSDITGLDVYAHRNAFVGNTAAGIRHDGLGGTFNATCNWWNSPSGPTNAGNPTGTGDAAEGSVTFAPWLTSSNLNGPCGAMAAKQDVLDQVNAAIPGASKHDADKLKDVSKKLTDSLTPSNWIDANHLQPKKGDHVFDDEKDAVHTFMDMQKDKNTQIPSATLQGWIDELVSADQTLAQTEITDATNAGGDAKKLADAQKEMANASASLSKGKYDEAIDHYKNAWHKAEESVHNL